MEWHQQLTGTGPLVPLATFCQSRIKQVKKGTRCSGVTFNAVRTNKKERCAGGGAGAIRVPGAFWVRWAHWLKKCMAAARREQCAWVTAQQMCRVVWLVFIWPAFFADNESPAGWSKNVLVLQALPHVCESPLFPLPLPANFEGPFPYGLPFNLSVALPFSPVDVSFFPASLPVFSRR